MSSTSSPSPSGSIATAAPNDTPAVSTSPTSPDVISEVFRSVRNPSVVSAQAGSWAAMRRRVRSTSRAMVSSWVGVRISLRGVVEDEVFEMHQFAVDPQRGAGVGEILALDPAGADRRAGDALVETGQRDTASKAGRIKAVMLIFARS
jgi:hypothetical protein